MEVGVEMSKTSADQIILSRSYEKTEAIETRSYLHELKSLVSVCFVIRFCLLTMNKMILPCTTSVNLTGRQLWLLRTTSQLTEKPNWLSQQKQVKVTSHQVCMHMI